MRGKDKILRLASLAQYDRIKKARAQYDRIINRSLSMTDFNSHCEAAAGGRERRSAITAAALLAGRCGSRPGNGNSGKAQT